MSAPRYYINLVHNCEECRNSDFLGVFCYADDTGVLLPDAPESNLKRKPITTEDIPDFCPLKVYKGE
jgi:hypothetical protein